MQKEDARFEFLQKTIIGFEQTKVSSELFNQELDETKNKMHGFDQRLDELFDSQKSMQNWIEKYEPLKVQHLITDTLSVCINRKARLKLAEYDLAKCAQLREKILADHGVPTFKERVLDLLTQIEKESQKVMGLMGVSPGGSDPNNKKQMSPVGKKPSVHSNNIAQLDDTGDELQHQQTPFNLAGAARATNMSNIGGGMDDDDSDGVEYLREQMLIQAQRMVQDLDTKFTARIEKEINRIKETHDQFVDEMLQRVGE